MGKNSTPQYNPPAPQPVKSASDLYGAATDYAKTNNPLAYGARESGLSDINKGNSYYEGFQPTSFEQALGNKYFQNVWPGQEESIKHGLSLSGLDSSPLLADRLGYARGQTEFNIGDYLSQQGNQRATASLNARMGIDPQSVLQGYLNTDTNQSNTNTSQYNDYQQQLAQVAYQQEVDKFNQKQQFYKTMGMMFPVAGNIYSAVDGGGGGFAASAGGTMDGVKMALPFLTAAMGGTPGLPGTSSPVNPTATGLSAMNVQPYNYAMNTSPYSPTNYFPGFSGRGGAV